MSIAGRLSVIVPTLNEREQLPTLVDSLRAQQQVDVECIVADGGSDDGTPALARELGATVIGSERGRGRQMNAGAQVASGEWLLFLHADCRLCADTQLRDAAAALSEAGSGIVAGHFALQFERRESGCDTLYGFLEAKSGSNRRYTINGDQGLLIRREHFDMLGGFDDTLPIFEDQRIAARIFACGRWLLLPGKLQTSARRFEAEGHRTRLTLMAMMMGAHAAGLHEFLRDAPRLYVAQHEAAPLQLLPLRRALIEVLHRRGLRETIGAAWQCGRLVRENVWQLALLRDVLRNEQRSLPFFDRHIARLVDNPVADGLATLLVAFWFFLWLPLQRGL